MPETLLILEDERLLASEMKRFFERQGWEARLAQDLAEARRALRDEALDPTVVLADLNLPDGNALELFEEMQQQAAPFGEWVFLTAYGSIPDSVRAVRLGAYEFLEKPYEEHRLDLVVNRAARAARAQRRLANEAKVASAQYAPERFVGRSSAAAHTRALLERVARTPFSALVIRGETGTGKGLAARILHYSSPRTHGPLVEVNCAALPRELLESELFGHEAGAYTGAKGRRQGLFEQAHEGSLFLDEISEMDLDLQAKLLTAVEDKRIRRVGGNKAIGVDVQVIAATNRDLQEARAEGRLREDLYHRLSVFEVVLPTLRERPEDLEDLVPAFIAEFNGKADKHVREVPEAAWSALRAHAWPGNVRELRNVIERCVLLSDGDTLETRWLGLAPSSREPGAPQVEGDRLCLPLDGSLSLDDMERRVIQEALARAQGNVTRAARLLGTTRQTLRYRIEKHGLGGDGEAENGGGEQ
jgi:two-component system response regulator AtoC